MKTHFCEGLLWRRFWSRTRLLCRLKLSGTKNNSIVSVAQEWFIIISSLGCDIISHFLQVRCTTFCRKCCSSNWLEHLWCCLHYYEIWTVKWWSPKDAFRPHFIRVRVRVGASDHIRQTAFSTKCCRGLQQLSWKIHPSLWLFPINLNYSHFNTDQNQAFKNSHCLTKNHSDDWF